MSTRKLFGKAAIFAVASIVQAVANLVAVPFLTRALAPSEFGLTVSGQVLLQVVWIVTSLGLPAAITRQYFNGGGGTVESRRFVSLALAACGAGLVLSQTTLDWWAPVFGFADGGIGARWAASAGICLAAVNATQAYQRAQGAAVVFVLSVGLSALVGNLLGVLLCVVVDSPGHEDYLLGLLLGNLLALLFGLLRARPARPRRSDLSTLRRIALPTLPHMLGVYLISAQDRLVVAARLGSNEVAHYQVAYLVGAVTMLGLQALNNAWAPMVLGAERERRTRFLHGSTIQISLLCGVGVLATAVLGQWALKAAAPADTYEVGDLGTVSVIIALGSIPALVYLSHSHLLYVEGRMGPFAVAAPLASATGFSVSWYLAGPWGLDGVAVGALAAQVVLAVVIRRAARTAEGAAGLGRKVVPGGVLAMVALGVHLVR